MKYTISKVSGPFSDGSKLRGQMFEVTAESADSMYPDMQFHVRLQQGDRFPENVVKGNTIRVEVGGSD